MFSVKPLISLRNSLILGLQPSRFSLSSPELCSEPAAPEPRLWDRGDALAALAEVGREKRTPNSKPVCRPVACGRRSIARAPTDALRSVNIELSADRCSPICAELMLHRPKLDLKATDPRKNFRAPIGVLRSVHQDYAPIDSHRSGPMLMSTDRWP